jgi:hypothetical protein
LRGHPAPRGQRPRRARWALGAGGLVALVAFFIFPQPAPATIQEQRERLPPPAECSDEVAGIWKSHQYDPLYNDWYIFTLDINRVDGDPNRLTGTIQAHSWDGGPEDEEPPPCRPGHFHWTVRMTAEGELDGMNVVFRGLTWAPENAYCGQAPGPGSYNVDRFHGTIDAAIQEFQSVNNDGGRAVNVPTVFRRISCHEPDAAPPSPHVNPVPPPFFPERGCSWF